MPAKGKMKKRQVKCLQRENEKAVGGIPAKGKMKKRQAECLHV